MKRCDSTSVPVPVLILEPFGGRAAHIFLFSSFFLLDLFVDKLLLPTANHSYRNCVRWSYVVRWINQFRVSRCGLSRMGGLER